MLQISTHVFYCIRCISQVSTCVLRFQHLFIIVTILSATEHHINISKLKSFNQPIAMIKARHSLGAQTLSADDMGGLEPVIYLSKGAKVILTMNLWTDVGLCTGAIGTVLDFVYAEGQQPPCLPICVLVQFDEEYKGSSVSSTFQRCVPISPITQVSGSLGQR